MLVESLISKAVEPAAAPIMAVAGGSYLYPIQGILHFVRNPLLWGNLLGMVLPQMVLTFVVFSLTYMFLYPMEAALALLFNGPTGIITAWIAATQQALAITMILSTMLLMPTPLRMLFDAILTNKGHDKLVLTGRLRQEPAHSGSQKIVNFMKRVPGWLIMPTWLLILVTNLVLSFVPVIGPLIAIVFSASGVAARCHERYFELKGFAPPEIKHFIRSRRGEMFAFGVVAASLEAIPFIGIAFVFTNTAGGALWAVDVESRLSPAPPQNQRRSRLKILFQDAY